MPAFNQSSYQIDNVDNFYFILATWALCLFCEGLFGPSHAVVLSSANCNKAAAVLAVLHAKTATYDGFDRQSTVHTEKKIEMVIGFGREGQSEPGIKVC